MRATVLVDNIGNDKAKGEWGLCIYIEYHDHKILLDAGASGLFTENAKKMGIVLKDIDYAVLSHAHYDHANGMKVFFCNNAKANFYLRDGCKENYYWKKWIFRKYIGIPKGLLNEYQDRIVFASGDYEIAEGIRLIPHKTPGLEQIGKSESMYVKSQGRWQPDSFAHEQSLVFDTAGGLVIFNSCSHGGPDNILKEVASTFPDKKIKAIVGGFHSFHKPEAVVRRMAKSMKETGIEQIYTGHCTGNKSYQIIKNELGEIVHQLKVGLVMEF